MQQCQLPVSGDNCGGKMLGAAAVNESRCAECTKKARTEIRCALLCRNSLIQQWVLCLFLFPLRFPIRALRLPIALAFEFAFDRIAAHLARVLGGSLLVIERSRHSKADFSLLEFAIGNRRFS